MFWCRCWEEVRDELEFQLLGYVVMPEHVYLWVTEPPRRGTPSTVLHKLKPRVATEDAKVKSARRCGTAPAARKTENHRGPSGRPAFYDVNV
jgi:REP element-mobilizing transposase RayT